MLELRRLRLLHELRARGTVAAVADALQFTPSAVSQQLTVLEREAGVKLFERAGRGLRLTDAALVLADHAAVLLDRAERAEADLAASTGVVAGRGRVTAFQSAAVHIATPAMRALERDVPALRCELVEAEPEWSLPALALGDVDLVIGDEWEHLPLPRPEGLVREDLWREPVHVVLPARHPLAREHPEAIPLAAAAAEPWVSGHPGIAWDEMTRRACRELGGFDPDIRHRTNDSVIALALVRAGLALTLLPALVDPGRHEGVAVRAIAEGTTHRTVFLATRAADAARPSVRALLEAVHAAAADAGPLPLGS